MSNWDVRGLTLEATIDNMNRPYMDMVEDTGPVTRDQLEDGEKVINENKSNIYLV